MSDDTPRTSAALGATLRAGWDLGPQHRVLTELCRELERENAMLRQGDTCARLCEGTAYRIECRRLRALAVEALDFTKYAAAAYAYTDTGSGTPDWFDGLRKQIETLQPKLMNVVTANVEVSGGAPLHGATSAGAQG